MLTLGIIPARGGSKGIPRKNLYPLNGKPLIDYTIETALRSNLDAVVISTDDEEIAKRYLYIPRPWQLAEDHVPMVPVIKHVVGTYEIIMDVDIDAVMVLQPTSPLRTVEDINNALDIFKNGNSDSLYSGHYMGIKHKEKPYDKHSTKPHFQRNGAIFLADRMLVERGKLWSSHAIEFEMPKSRSIDIDDMDDMFMAEAIMKHTEAKI